MGVHRQYPAFKADWARLDEPLRALFAEGRSASEMAAALSRLGNGPVTRNAVIGRVHRLKLNRGPVAPPPKRVENKVPGLAWGVVTPAPDKRRLLRERTRQKTNFDFGHARLRREAQASAARIPAADRFAEGFLGQQGRVGLAELEARHCRYPVDQPAGAVRYCGLDRLEGSSYCAEHHRRCNDGLPQPKARGA